MSDDTRLNDLTEAWKKMEANDNKKVLKEGANDPTPTSKKFSIADTHSAAVKPVGRNPGAVDGAKEVGDEHGTTKTEPTAKPIKREAGAVAGAKEVGDEHGTTKAESTAKPVPRSEGSAASPQKYEEFRNKIKGVLGLALTDPINAVGKGLNAPNIAGKTKTK